VFSPYYAAARRREPADPLNHVSFNAILYTKRGKRWAMTERGKGAIVRSADRISIGPSAMRHDGDRLVIDIDEWSVPLPRRLRGRITIDLGTLFDTVHDLNESGRHRWRPIAPLARADVEFARPGIGWQGRAYVDMNVGSEPLEAAFRRWNWSREEAASSTRIRYDVEPRHGQRRTLGFDYGPDGSIHALPDEPELTLPMTGWRVARATRSEAIDQPRVLRTLEDTPFYSRSMLAIGSESDTRKAVHESVDLDRFASRWVQMLLPFRMPRIGR
jgi:carotenoid 1,2-hydratase